MTNIQGLGVPPAAAGTERARLREAAENFEAVFISQMLKEMRATVPQDSGEGGAGQDMFAGFFDDAIAREAARRSTHGLAEALFRQLERRLGAPEADGGK